MTRALLTFLFLGATWNLCMAQSGQVSDTRPVEYMIYQYPNIALVVKIEAAESEFESVIYGPEKALLKSSGVPAARIGPLYQYIDSTDIPRQLMIKITPARPVDRSQISMELIQLPDRDWKSGAYGQAYSLMSSGTETEHGKESSTWSRKIYTLRNAAEAFARLGWEEMRLWSGFYAAHLVLHQLNDVLMAMELVQAVRASAQRAGFEEIELAALVLEGEALQRAAGSATGQVAFRRYEQLHAILDQVVILADRLGLPSEQARALYYDGLAYEQQDRVDDAVRMFRAALDVSLTTNNTELTNEIRGIAAAAYESQGSTTGAIEMLEDISDDLDRDTGLEYVENLFERGRLLNNTYRFPEAASELSKALSIQQADAATGSWGVTGLELAWSWYSMGEMEKARELILESIPRAELAASRSALIKSYDVLARIHRDRGQFDQVTLYRQKQEELIRSEADRAGFMFESAIDAWRKEGTRSSRAVELMGRSRRAAAAGDLSLAEDRSTVFECLMRVEGGSGGNCTAAAISRPLENLAQAGIPWMALEARLVRGRILQREGRRHEALTLLGSLVDDLLFFRQELPGVLGGWYWLERAEIFRHYLAAAAADSDGRQTLIALDRVRLAQDPGGDWQQHEDLRVLLASRESSADQDSARLAAQANAQWTNLRNGFQPATRPVDRRSLDGILERLAADQVILAYYFGPSSIHAVVGSRDGVSMHRLAGFRAVSGQLERLRQSLDERGVDLLRYLDALGDSLVQPLSKELRPTIYLLPGGPLNGFPFDALRLNGAFLAEQHTVANLHGLAGTSIPHSVSGGELGQSVFLAGNPQAGQELFSYDVALSAEVTAVTDAFVGPGLTIVQGVALQKDEFRDPRFAASGLIHLAVPGTLDLARPDHSTLLMSRASRESETDDLRPPDIRGLDFTADLVVLSRTGVAARAQSVFDSRLGFVSDFLIRGVRNVVVSLQSGTDSETAAFMVDFYDELKTAQNIPEALSRTRIRLMKSTDPGNFMAWAGFQLYIR